MYLKKSNILYKDNIDEDDLPKEVNIDITHCFQKLYLYVYINNTNNSQINDGKEEGIEFGEIEIEKYKKDGFFK